MSGVYSGYNFASPSHRAQIPKVSDVTLLAPAGANVTAQGCAIDFARGVYYNRTLFGSGLPGDVAPDNDIVLEEDMFFVIHPNQYLPETGYMMCGEPTLITATGAETLTRNMARLYEVAV